VSIHRFKVYNAAMPTTAALAKVTTGTAIKTMLQLATPATRMIQVVSWGYTLDAVPGSTGGQVELIQTDVAATVSAHVASGVQQLDPNAPNSLLTLGSSATGYTATAEGTPTAVRVFDEVLIPPTAGAEAMTYEYQFLPDEQPVIAISKFLRVRVTFAAAVNMLCWVTFNE
jgi:hypothetical protein